MTSTRVIRGFKVDTTKAANRVTVLPTPQKLTADVGNFQDIGAKIVRPTSRKAVTHLARKTGLRTSQGLAEQLVKEEGIKISIGDKTLKELLQVEVPDMRKQEYIKDDGSVGVRKVPVLDSKGNPVLVKKNLSIPGTVEHFQKPMAEKLADLEQILKDQTKSASDKSDVLAVLIMSMMRGSPPPSGDDAKHMSDFADDISMSEDPIAAGLSEDGLDEGRFADFNYLTRNQDKVFLYLMKFAKSRGLPRGNLLYDIQGRPLEIDNIIPNLSDVDGNPRTVDLLTSRIQPSQFESGSVERPLIEFKEFEPEPEPVAEEPITFEEPELGLSTQVRSTAILIGQLTQEQKDDIDKREFSRKSELEKEAFLKTILKSVEEFQEPTEEFEEREVKMNPNLRKIVFKAADFPLDPSPKGAKRGNGEFQFQLGRLEKQLDEFNKGAITKKIILIRLRNMIRSNASDTALGNTGDHPTEDRLLRPSESPFTAWIPVMNNEATRLIRLIESTEERGEDPPPQIVQQFLGNLSEDEHKTYSRLIAKNLKEGVILVPSRSISVLNAILEGTRDRKKGTDAIDRSLGIRTAEMSDNELRVLKKMKLNKPSLIISSTTVIGSGMEGRGHYGVIHSGVQYGYARPNYSLQQKMMCC